MAANVLATGAQLLVTANPGRRTAARDIGLAHTVEVVDASMRGLPVDSLRR